MATDMPVVKGAFGDTPQIEFPSEQAPQGLKVVELEEATGRLYVVATR